MSDVSNSLVIRNGQVVTPDGIVEGGVRVEHGVIVAIGPDSELGSATRTVDLNHRALLPGLIDPHIHFGYGDEPDDDTMLEDFKNSSKDCLIGGVTTISSTTMISHQSLMDLYQRAMRCADGHSFIDYEFTPVVTTMNQIPEISSVVEAGAVSFKFFAGYAGEQAEEFGMDPAGVTPELFYRSCEAMKKASPIAFPKIHAEEPFVRGILVDRMKDRYPDSANLLAHWADSSPEWAESAQIHSFGLIAHEVGVPLYPVHVSSAFTLDTIRAMRAQGIPIMAETLAYFLATTAEEMDAKGARARGKIQPPLRHEADKEALWRGIKDGTIRYIGTDSETHSAHHKDSADFWECRVGINLQTADTLPLLLNEGVRKGRIDLVDLAKVTATNVAQQYGLYPKKGAIVVGADADLVVVDPDIQMTLGVDRYRSGNDHSLWEGEVVQGGPVMTFLRGRLVMEDGEIVVDEPSGEFVRATAS